MEEVLIQTSTWFLLVEMRGNKLAVSNNYDHE